MSEAKRFGTNSESDGLDYEREVQQLRTLQRGAGRGGTREGATFGGGGAAAFQRDFQQAEAQRSDHLLEQISQLQLNLNRTNDVLYKRVYEQDQEIAELKKNLRLLQGEKEWKANQVDELHLRFRDSQDKHQEFTGYAQQNAQKLHREVDHREREVARLTELLAERTDRLKVVTVTQEKNVEKCIELDRRNAELLAENRDLRAQLQKGSFDNESLRLGKQAEGVFLVEVDHLRADVRRLVKMLRSTQEFRDFAELADEGDGNIRFLKDIRQKTYVDIGCNCRCKNVRPCAEDEVLDEKMLWAPEEAWKFAHEFRLKYQGEMTDTLIEHLMFELNKIWSRREKVLTSKIRSNCAHEAAALKRQLAFNPQYDEHQAKTTIARLKAQLKQAYKENRELFADRSSRNPPGTKFVSETLKLSKNAHKAKSDATDKNRLLRQKLADLESLKFLDNSEKQIFMEGAAWLGGKVVTDADELKTQFKTYLKEFEAKVATGTTEDLQRKQDWLLENIDTLLKRFAERTQEYKRQSEKEMAASKKILRPLTAGTIKTFV